jgi:hypothetical protein
LSPIALSVSGPQDVPSINRRASVSTSQSRPANEPV